MTAVTAARTARYVGDGYRPPRVHQVRTAAVTWRTPDPVLRVITACGKSLGSDVRPLKLAHREPDLRGTPCIACADTAVRTPERAAWKPEPR